MLHSEVAAQGLGAKPAFKTDDMILLHRTPDRDRRCQPCRPRWRRSAETTECLVYGCDQSRDLIASDRAFRNITLDDIRHQSGLSSRWIGRFERASVR
jgi:hypothetical protein